MQDLSNVFADFVKEQERQKHVIFPRLFYAVKVIDEDSKEKWLQARCYSYTVPFGGVEGDVEYSCTLKKSEATLWDEIPIAEEEAEYVTDFTTMKSKKIVPVLKFEPHYAYDFGVKQNIAHWLKINIQDWNNSYAYYARELGKLRVLTKHPIVKLIMRPFTFIPNLLSSLKTANKRIVEN